ncbi:MAG: hypothetical protein V3V08_20545 [Nannocystaceae bacterium]
MSQNHSPLKRVQDLFGSKEKLIEKLASVLERDDGVSEDDLKIRLKHAPNSKLLRLLRVSEALEAAGGRDALVQNVAKLRGHANDKDYVAKLAGRSAASLLDAHRSLSLAAKKKATPQAVAPRP